MSNREAGGWKGHSGWRYRLHPEQGIVRSVAGGPWEVVSGSLSVSTVERGMRPLAEAVAELLDQLASVLGEHEDGSPRFTNPKTADHYAKTRHALRGVTR